MLDRKRETQSDTSRCDIKAISVVNVSMVSINPCRKVNVGGFILLFNVGSICIFYVLACIILSVVFDAQQVYLIYIQTSFNRVLCKRSIQQKLHKKATYFCIIVFSNVFLCIIVLAYSTENRLRLSSLLHILINN